MNKVAKLEKSLHLTDPSIWKRMTHCVIIHFHVVYHLKLFAAITSTKFQWPKGYRHRVKEKERKKRAEGRNDVSTMMALADPDRWNKHLREREGKQCTL